MGFVAAMFDFGWLTATLIMIVIYVSARLIATGRRENYWLAAAFLVSLVGARIGSAVESPIILAVFLTLAASLSWKSGTYGARLVTAIYFVRVIITVLSHLYAIQFVYLGDATNLLLLVQMVIGGFIAADGKRSASKLSGNRIPVGRMSRLGAVLARRYYT